jgi:hypothetical protein
MADEIAFHIERQTRKNETLGYRLPKRACLRYGNLVGRRDGVRKHGARGAALRST